MKRLKDSIDRFLQGQESKAQTRRMTNEGRMQIHASFFGRAPMTGLSALSLRLSQNYPKEVSTNQSLNPREGKEARGKAFPSHRFQPSKGKPRRPKMNGSTVFHFV